MIATMVSAVLVVLFLLIGIVIGRAVLNKQPVFGTPPIPLGFFVLAKMLVVGNLAFLVLKGLRVDVATLVATNDVSDVIALAFLVLGTSVLIASTLSLKSDLIFGLSAKEDHRLRTTGIYSVSRHPFYLGFIFILFSSCLFVPHYANIAAFLGAWMLHHRIMLREEEYLTAQYGEEYTRYATQVRRYITLRRN